MDSSALEQSSSRTSICISANEDAEVIDRGPILNEHFRLSAEINRCLREHLHIEAGIAAREMVAIADKAYADLITLSTEGMHTSTGFIKSGFSDFHAGYDYLTDKGYMHGQCSADEAIALCQQAKQQKWWDGWDDRIEAIREHERLLIFAKALIRETPGIIQSDLLKKHPEIGSTTLYYAALRGEIRRIKAGRSYGLYEVRNVRSATE